MNDHHSVPPIPTPSEAVREFGLPARALHNAMDHHHLHAPIPVKPVKRKFDWTPSIVALVVSIIYFGGQVIAAHHY